MKESDLSSILESAHEGCFARDYRPRYATIAELVGRAVSSAEYGTPVAEKIGREYLGIGRRLRVKIPRESYLL